MCVKWWGLVGWGVWVHREERERWVYKKLVGMEAECGKGYGEGRRGALGNGGGSGGRLGMSDSLNGDLFGVGV